MSPPALLDVNTVFFSVLEYPMSYIEFFGTLLNLAAVILIARKNVWTWPIGIVAVVLFALLFYQIQLYADFIEQLYYFATNIYGWWLWQRRGTESAAPAVRFSSAKFTGWVLAATLVLSAAGGWLVERLHIFWPTLFLEPASFAYIDALTTVGSFTAMLLMAHRRTECWIYWLVIDVIGVVLYYVKDARFVAILYVVFLALAVYGLREWLKKAQTSGAPAPAPALS